MQDKIAGGALDYGPRAARFFHKIRLSHGRVVETTAYSP